MMVGRMRSSCIKQSSGSLDNRYLKALIYRQAAIDLDYKNPKLYKKVLRFYEDQGVEFYDDPYDTYELVVDLLKEDLQKVKSEA